MPRKAIATDAVHSLIGPRIRIERRARGWSQSNLADIVGVTYQQIHKYEVGRNLPPIGSLIALAEAFRIPLDLLIGNRSDDPSAGPSERADLELMRAFAPLPAAQKRAIVALVRALAEGPAQPASRDAAE